MALAKATLGTSIGTVYTSTNDSATTSIFFTNDNASARTIDVHLVANGDTADATNRIIKNLSIDGTDTYVMSQEKIVFSNGDTIQALCSDASSVYATVSYVSI
jgi:hypothetical protein